MDHNQAVIEAVTIVGAGIGGLTLAKALLRHGVRVSVFERCDGLAEVGAGITLWGNAMNALEHIGAGSAVRDCARLTASGALGLSDGRLLVNVGPQRADKAGPSPAEPTEQVWAMHRAALQHALYAQLPNDCVTFGAGFQSYETTERGVRVHFTNHPSIDTDLLVGADGLHSRVRQLMVGTQPPRYAGYACYRAVSPIPPGWAGQCGEFWGKGDRFGVVELPGRRLYWFAVVNQTQGSRPEAPFKPYLKQRFGGYAFDVAHVIEATPESAILYHELFDRDPLPSLSAGRVCLLGDAAHPTTPNLGQGAAMAIESAVILARALVESTTLDEALQRYDRTRLPRTSAVTRRSRLIGEMAQLQNPLLRWLRNTLVRLTPRSSRLAQLRPLVDYDAAHVPLEHAS